MLYEKGFARDAFKKYVSETYDIPSGSHAMDIVDNIINYGLANLNNSLDQLAYFLEETIVNDFGEAAAFCQDSILTKYGRDEKNEFIRNFEEFKSIYGVPERENTDRDFQ